MKLEHNSKLLVPLLLCLIWILPLRGQPVTEICVPEAVGVPYSPGAPNWWETTPPSTLADGGGLWDRIDDPRWNGAASVTYDNGTIDSYYFRALYKDGHLLLSWMIKKTLFGANENILFVGLSREKTYSPNGALGIQVYVNSGAGNNKPPSKVSVRFINNAFCLDGGSYNPPWRNEIRVWDGSGSTPDYWGVNIRLPLDQPLIPTLSNSIQLPSDGTEFFMFFDVLMGAVGFTANLQNQIEFAWPRTAFISKSTSCDTLYPDFGNFGDMRIGTQNTTCSKGITIDRLDIGTEHTSGAGYISRTLDNTFYAKPLNNSALGIDSQALHARFRIANWGTQPAINTNLSTAWVTIPGLENVQQPISGTVNHNDHWNIRKTLPAGTAFFNQFDNSTKSAHQCMLVELFGANLYFERNSVFRNMNFVQNSKYEEEAEISVNGLTPLPYGERNRDVYLHVQTYNMPSQTSEDSDTSYLTSSKTLAEKLNELKSKRDMLRKQSEERARKYKAYSPGGAARADSLQPYTDEQIEDLINADLRLHEHIAMLQPTYIVHGYYDTGRRLGKPGDEKRILRPMTSFGYFLMHEGELEGWKHELSSQNPTFEEIAPDWYKISTDSVTRVNVMIASLEPPVCRWWLWLLLLAVLLVIFWIWKKGKQ